MDSVIEQWLFVEEGSLSKRWTKYFTRLDKSDSLLTLHQNESSRRIRAFVVQNCEFYDAVKSKGVPCCIKIVTHVGRSTIPVYLYAEDLRTIDEIKQAIEECGGQFEGLDIPRTGFTCFQSAGVVRSRSTGQTRLERTPVRQWNKSDVAQWLQMIGAEGSTDVFSDNDVDGTILIELNELDLRNMSVPDDCVKMIAMEVLRLRKTGSFSRDLTVVRSKFQRFPGFQSQAEEYEDIVDSLCDVTMLKHRFLSTAELSSHTLKKIVSPQYHTIGAQAPDTMQQFGNEATIKVKLVVTEILQTARAKALRSIASPLISAMIPDFRQEFGFFHTAVIVGPWYLEWTDSELVIPKRMVSGNAIISADVDQLIVGREDLPMISDKIAEVVVKWNTRFKYRNARVGGLRDNEGNCQDFVDEILEAIGIKTNFRGALGGFLEKMRKSGKCVLEFTPCTEFREYFNIAERSWMFETHQELDNFCSRIREACLDIGNTFSSEWSLLKSFDRAYWLRHLKDPQDPKYIPKPPTTRMADFWEDRRIVFVTGNAGKFREAKGIIGTSAVVENIDFDIPEWQDTVEVIAREKCRQAYDLVREKKGHSVPVLVEDTSLEFVALGGMPGPYIKDFLKRVGVPNLPRMLDGFENKAAVAVCACAFKWKDDQEPVVMVGRVPGTIVEPRGARNFGWDPIFQPDGYDETFGQMSEDLKNTISHRYNAFKQVQEHLMAL